LQGFPDSYKIVCNDSQIRKQAGNSLPVPVAQSVIKSVIEACGINLYSTQEATRYSAIDGQLQCFEESARYNERTKNKNSRKIQTSISA
jgi:DNA (cytosine-5)-methyltransferase 1